MKYVIEKLASCFREEDAATGRIGSDFVRRQDATGGVVERSDSRDSGATVREPGAQGPRTRRDPTNITRLVTSLPHSAGAALDQGVELRGVQWDDRERLLEIRGEKSVPRMTFCEAVLEPMTPSLERSAGSSSAGPGSAGSG